MQQSTKDTSEKKTEAKHLPNSELLQSQTNAQNQEPKENSSDDIFTIEEIEEMNVPFKILYRTDEKEYALILGRMRITDWTTNRQSIIDRLANKDWHTILSTVIALIEHDK